MATSSKPSHQITCGFLLLLDKKLNFTWSSTASFYIGHIQHKKRYECKKGGKMCVLVEVHECSIDGKMRIMLKNDIWKNYDFTVSRSKEVIEKH